MIKIFFNAIFTYMAINAGCVEAAEDQVISVRCSLALGKTISQLPSVKRSANKEYLVGYSGVRCEDRGDFIRVSYRLASREVLMHDGEDYFLIDADSWVVVEKWVGGGGWVDPDYERKVLEGINRRSQ